MIRYQMQCSDDHLFDGWFSNSAAFDAQANAHQIECPVCGSLDVRKALMAPNLSPRTKLRGEPLSAPEPERQPLQPGTTSSDPAETDPGSFGPRSSDLGELPSDAEQSASPAPSSDTPQTGSLPPGKSLASEKSLAPEESFAMMREISNAMRRLRREVEKNADYVGPRFAEEARKIHYEEVEPRGIYGEASKEDIEELNEEGVEFIPLPSLPEDSN